MLGFYRVEDGRRYLDCLLVESLAVYGRIV